jgi:outer membrane protein OmpA-like peptidoglycan-associated protein
MQLMKHSRKMAMAADGFQVSGVKTAPGRNWMGVALEAAIVLAAALWVYNHNNRVSVSSLAVEDAAAVESSVEDSGDVPASEILPETLDSLSEYLNAPVLSELPKRFRFENINFESGEAILMSGAEPDLQQIVAAMKAHPEAHARIEGYTDNVGQPEANLALSNRRAQAIRALLISRGVHPDQLEAIGRGSENSITSNASIEGRAMNRRIEFVVTQVQ